MRELFQTELLLLIGIVIISGFYMGMAAKKLRLPSLIGFMVLGVIVGPSALGFFENNNLEHLSFITQIALGFVAFGIGSELNLSSLRKLGRGIIAIIFSESLIAFVVVMLGIYALTRSWSLALLFGAVAPASAPAGTVAIIQEYKARGTLTKALYAVVGFDDGLAILIFGLAASIAKVILLNKLGVQDSATGGIFAAMTAPLIEILSSILVGTILGFLFCGLVRRMELGRDLLIMTFGVIFIGCGIATHFHLSLILTNMVIGFVLTNTRREAFVHKVTLPLQDIMPLIFLLFFALAGAHLQIREVPKLGLIGTVYIIARSTGLIGGARLGSMIGRVEPKIKKYVGFGILSQAGVAIGLSLIVQHDFGVLANRPDVAEAVRTYASLHPDVSLFLYNPMHIAGILITTITASCIFFEIVGPILTKYALTKAGEIPTGETQEIV